MSWREGAACKGLPPDLFFPPLFKGERYGVPEPSYYGLGKLACEVCPVKERCLVDGEEEEFGLWGGTTPKERGGKPVKAPTKVLPAHKLDYLAALGPNPDIPDLWELIKPHLERRPKKDVDSVVEPE
jgi:hypothetical protein